MNVPTLMTFTDAFYRTCIKFPSRPAQKFNSELYHNDNNGSFTYDELRQRVEGIACGLLSLGINKGDMAAIMSPSSPHWTQTDLALASIGAISVTIYPTLSMNEVSYIVNDSRSKIIFVGSKELYEKVNADILKMPSLQHIIVLDLAFEGDGNFSYGLTQLLERGKNYSQTNFAIYEAARKDVTLDDPLTILYTSGTTGLGKGVVLTNHNQATRMVGTLDFFGKYEMTPTENDTTLCFLPLSHVFDRGSCQILAIWQGSCIAYADSPATLMTDMQKYNPTWINCVPRLYEKMYITIKQQMSESPTKERIFNWALKIGEEALQYRMDEKGRINMSPNFDLRSKLPLGLRLKFSLADKLFAKIRALFGSNYKLSFSASAAIAPELLTFFYSVGIAVCEGYGSTESFNAAILTPLTACKPGKMGINANGSKSRIAADGELELSAAGIFKEYLNKPEETAESFTEDGWFKTGDLVEIDEDGYYKMVDRKKAIICLAIGKNVAPAKIENLYSTSSTIEQMFTIGDERNFITTLLIPNFTYFIELFEKENIEYDKSKLVYAQIAGAELCIQVGEDFINQPRLREAIAAEVKANNELLEDFEVIKKYAILPSRFTEETGELTPTLKVKKRVVLEKYKDIIDGLY